MENILEAEIKSFSYGEASRLTVMNAALDRIEEVLHETELCDKGVLHLPKESPSPEVEFKQVSFSYGDNEVLHDISFKIKKNTMTALIGESGYHFQ